MPDLRFSPYGHSTPASSTRTTDALIEPRTVGPRTLKRSAQVVYERHKRTGGPEFLDAAIRLMQRAVTIALEPDSLLLGMLGHYLRARYDSQGGLEDLESSISITKRALELTPSGHDQEHARLHNLGCCLQRRYNRLDELCDLEDAIVAHRRAEELTSDDHPRKSSRLNNLGLCLQNRFKRLGRLDDLESAIVLHRRAVALCPDGHPDEAARLNSLGLSMRRRFDRLGEIDDLESALRMQQCAIEIIPDSHPDMPVCLDDLALCLRRRFDRFGDLDDLERAITTQSRAVELTRKGSRDEKALLDNLASCLKCRFDHLGLPEDLERAITIQQRVIELSPNDHPAKPRRLSNLGLSLQSRFDRLKDHNDLARAIVVQKRAAELTARGHPDEPSILSNLGLSLQSRFVLLGELDDLQRAIAAQRHSLRLTPEDHPDRPARLSNLGLALRSRFDALNNIDDLQSAITAQRISMNLIPYGHPGKLFVQNNLGHSLWRRFLRDQTHPSFYESVSFFLDATAQTLVPPHLRLSTAEFCVQILSENPKHSSTQTLLLAHSRVMEIIPELVWLGHSVTRRFEESQRLGRLVNNAVCVAIVTGTLRQAIQWLETGRALVWSQISSLRTPLRDLERCHPHHALALQSVIQQLQQSGDTSLVPDPSIEGRPNVVVDGEITIASEHHRAALRYGRLIREIRLCAGFKDFLRPDMSLDLTRTATGPVVFINVAAARCDAVICDRWVTKRIALPNLSEQRATQLRSEWRKFLSDCGARHRASLQRRDPAELRNSYADCFARILEKLWLWVVNPILQALDVKPGGGSMGRLPHITWCPTGPLMQLPLHAAGVYTQPGGPRAYNLIVSSYTPSLSVLLRCQEGLRDQSRRPRPPKVLIVSQPETPFQSPLPGVRDESARICDILPRRASTVLEHDEATVSATLDVLDDHSWAHFACHGFQNPDHPTQSAFQLFDGPLTLAALLGKAADNAQLAFLSACQTATGDVNMPEESAHLAAGMLAVGFKGVVATMWSIRDDDAPLVVETYYEKLLALRESGTLGTGETGAAYAIHEAVKRLREEVGEQNFMQWAPFVHFGV